MLCKILSGAIFIEDRPLKFNLSLITIKIQSQFTIISHLKNNHIRNAIFNNPKYQYLTKHLTNNN